MNIIFMPNPEKNPSLSEEKIKELQERSLGDMDEAKTQDRVSSFKLSSFVEKGLLEEKIFQPSHESLLLIEQGAEYLSEKQQELLKIQAYFYEKCAGEISNLIMNEGKKGVDFNSTAKDLKKMDNVINELSLKYENINLLNRQMEYPAARKMIDEIRDYLSKIKKNELEPQPLPVVWGNISNRTENLHSIFLMQGVKDPKLMSNTLGLLAAMKLSIFERAPKVIRNRK